MIICLQMIGTDEERTKFEQIYERYFGLMFHIAYQILGHYQDSEDAVHQAFVSIAENIIKAPDPARAKGYVSIIVERKAIDMLRKRKRHTVTTLDDDLPGVEVKYDGDDFLMTCIFELTPLQRQVIWLKYHYGYDLHEIAKMLDISLPWAIQVDQRAKKKLKKLYEEGDEQV